MDKWDSIACMFCANLIYFFKMLLLSESMYKTCPLKSQYLFDFVRLFIFSLYKMNFKTKITKCTFSGCVTMSHCRFLLKQRCLFQLLTVTNILDSLLAETGRPDGMQRDLFRCALATDLLLSRVFSVLFPNTKSNV